MPNFVIYRMVNNAGIFTGLKTIVDETVEDFDRTIAVNARGTFLGMKYAIAQMMKQEPLESGERGWIVNIASAGGQIGVPMERRCPFYFDFLVLLLTRGFHFH